MVNQFSNVRAGEFGFLEARADYFDRLKTEPDKVMRLCPEDSYLTETAAGIREALAEISRLRSILSKCKCDG